MINRAEQGWPEEREIGYDYKNQAWVVGGKYVRCGHQGNSCQCYGRLHEGETVVNDPKRPTIFDPNLVS